MKRGLVFIVFVTIGFHCFAQCAFPSTLKTNDSLCLGTDTLFVSSPGNVINKITWFNGNTADTTVIATVAPIYITVAGGNGNGAAANQLHRQAGIFIDASGNLYVADAENSRIIRFPPGSSSATNGITVAFGYGQGTAADQFTGSYGLFVTANGDLYVSDLIDSRILELTTESSIDTVYVPAAPATYRAVVTDTAGCMDTTNVLVISAPPNPTQ
jgi:hypothetical protein